MDDPILEEYRKIGNRIRNARIQQKLSQSDVAEKANLSLCQISNIELGKAQMRLLTFRQIAEALQVSADELLRTDVPAVNQMYQNELAEILSDCSPSEMDSIVKVVTEIKKALRQKSAEYNL